MMLATTQARKGASEKVCWWRDGLLYTRLFVSVSSTRESCSVPGAPRHCCNTNKLSGFLLPVKATAVEKTANK